MRGPAKAGVWLGAAAAVLVCAGVTSQAAALDLVASPVVRIGPDPASVEGRGARLREALDQAFGQGRWHITSGFRSQERENELRAAGAGTVPVGATSHHSMGTESSPGAYDVVVAGMSQSRAAQLLRQVDPGFGRILYERAHGPEGPHLHIEMGGGGGAAVLGGPLAGVKTISISARMDACNSIYERVVGGHRNPKLKGC
jgi:hypothetical protein